MSETWDRTAYPVISRQPALPPEPQLLLPAAGCRPAQTTDHLDFLTLGHGESWVWLGTLAKSTTFHRHVPNLLLFYLQVN